MPLQVKVTLLSYFDCICALPQGQSQARINNNPDIDVRIFNTKSLI